MILNDKETNNPFDNLLSPLDNFEQALLSVHFNDEEEKDDTLSAYPSTSKRSLEAFLSSLGYDMQSHIEGVLRVADLFDLVLRPLERQSPTSRPHSNALKLFGLLKTTLIVGNVLCDDNSRAVIAKIDYMSRRASTIKGDEAEIVPEPTVQHFLAQIATAIIDNCSMILKLKTRHEVEAFTPGVDVINEACSELEEKCKEGWQKLQKVQGWIEKLFGNMPNKHGSCVDRHVADTGTKFVAEVRKWLEAKKFPTFLAYGPQGVGKTFLACAVISCEKGFEGIDGLAYIYFSVNDQDRQRIPFIYADIISQLLKSSSRLRNEMFLLFDKYSDSSVKHKQQILMGMNRAVKNLTSSTMLVLDALDEASEDTRDVMLDLLEESSDESARILVTSRYDYQGSLERARVLRRYVLSPDTEDIRIFLEKRLDNREIDRILKAQLGSGTKAQKFISGIKKDILDKSGGLFLHIEHAVKDIHEQADIDGIKNAVSKRYESTNKIYADTLKRIDRLPEVKRQLAYRVIAWLAFTKKRFREIELKEAFSTSSEGNPDFPQSKLVMENAIEYCQGLLRRVKMTKVSYLELAHSTVREYVLENPVFQPYHLDMCLTCFSSVIACLTSRSRSNSGQGDRHNGQNSISQRENEFYDSSDESSTDWSASEESGDTTTDDFEAELEATELRQIVDNEDVKTNSSEGSDADAILEDDQSWRVKRNPWPQTFFPWMAKTTPFSLYAARYALCHLEEATISGEVGKVVLDLIQTAMSRRPKSRASGKVRHHPYSMNILHMATFIGIPSIIKTILEMSLVNIDDKDILGRTALMWALGLGKDEAANTLLDAGAQFQELDNQENSALTYALTIRNKALLRKVLDKMPKQHVTLGLLFSCTKSDNTFLLDMALQHANIDVNRVDKDDMALIHHAAIFGSADAVSLLIGHGSDVSAPDSNNQTPLMYASGGQSLRIVKSLLKAGANPDAPFKKMKSALHVAARNTKRGLKVMDLLIRAKASILMEDEEGLVPLQAFLRSCNLERRSEQEALSGVRLLSSDPRAIANQSLDGTNVLHEAARCPHVSVLQYLVSRAPIGAINAQKNHGITPIFDAMLYSMESGSRDTLEILLEHPAIDLLEVHDDKDTLLNCAAWYNDVALMRRLIKKEPRLIGLADEYSSPTLFRAIGHSNEEMFYLLIEAGSDPKARCAWGEDLIAHAATKGCVWGLDILLNLRSWLIIDDLGNTVANKDNCGKTLLHEAAVGPSTALLERITRVLPLEGLSLEDRDITGETPLHMAAKHGRYTSVGLLLRAGSEKDVTTPAGQNALDLALESGSNETVRTLILANANLGPRTLLNTWSVGTYSKSDFGTKLKDLISARDTKQAKNLDTYGVSTNKEKTVCRVGTDVFHDSSPDIPYLEVTVPRNAALPLAKVIFETVSHDQGWSSYAEYKGTYRESFSFFDIAVQFHQCRAEHSQRTEPLRMRLQSNRHADVMFRTHVNVFDPAEHYQEQARRDWVEDLRPGDRIQLFAKAKYLGWQNFVQSAKITLLYHEMAVENADQDNSSETPIKPSSSRMFDPGARTADHFHQPVLIVYHQSLYDENGILTSLRPLVQEGTGVTAVALGTFYLRNRTVPESEPEERKTEFGLGAVVDLNDIAMDDPSIDDIWVDVECLRNQGVKVIGVLRIYGEGCRPTVEGNLLMGKDLPFLESSYKTIHDFVLSKGLDGLEFDLESDSSRPEANSPDMMTADGFIRLVDKLRVDFGNGFIVAVTASAEELLGNSSNEQSSHIDYQAIERQNPSCVNWYNIRLFSNHQEGGDSIAKYTSDLSLYINLIESGTYATDKLLLYLLATPDIVSEASERHSTYLKPDILRGLLELIRWSYSPSKFGGLAVWEYLSCHRNSEAAESQAAPWTWVKRTRQVLDTVLSGQT